MVTSNKLPDKKVVKMAEHNNSSVIPQRTLLGEVNEHITCPLCRGYYIDATTIVECLHSFCRSCIIKHLQVKSYCPVCEMMINSAKPNIKLDKALQDIVYKLVPGLFQKEMERRQQFYASHPGQAASATPEQRGEDTERIIFSPEDVISFSLEYADATDTDSISSKSSDSNEPQPPSAVTRRYLQCPAVVNISHLKKFLSMKFDIDSTQFAIDILYKRVPLPDYYTLMDIAYIYNWKRNEPMRFFYQIIDYVAIRNRLFDINRKGSHYEDRKSSPAPTEDTNVSSPAANLNEPGSEASSGTDSPMPDDDNIKKVSDASKTNERSPQQIKNSNTQDNLDLNKSNCPSPLKKPDDEVEKSQFLNSFELTAKNHNNSLKSSPVKSSMIENVTEDTTAKLQNNSPKTEETLKRKYQTPPNTPEVKKLKIELEKSKILNNIHSSVGNHDNETLTVSNQVRKASEASSKISEIESNKSSQSINKTSTTSLPIKDSKQEPNILKHQTPESPSVKENPGVKRNVCGTQNMSSPKRKPNELTSSTSCLLAGQKSITPIKPQVQKLEAQPSSKLSDTQKPLKKMPELKPSVPSLQTTQSKTPFNKVRMDLLANNSDPTIDRSKILSQVKSSLSNPSTTQTSGDPLKSLFDSCKINIPSSLSITLTDQKLDTRNAGDSTNLEQKKAVLNKNLTAATNVTHKVPSPPVHNYIEILKLPEGDLKKQQNKIENNPDVKTNTNIKPDASSVQSKPNKPPETSSKGPVPNLKPISDTKLAKQSGNISAPITFQQTFEQQLQSMQSDKKSKLPKTKTQVPKLVPATPKAFNAVNKLNSNIKSSMSTVSSIENKTGAALDLSTPHNVQSQLGPQQTKAFETMQSIANLAKKQNLPSKGLPTSMMQSNLYSSVANRPPGTGINQLRVPTTSTINQLNLDKGNPSVSQSSSPRQETNNKVNPSKQTNNSSPITPPAYHIPNAPNMTQPSPRSQTRSPSSSPKLVIAEDKQLGNSLESSINQSNQISSTQLPNLGAPKSESPKPSPGTSKSTIKTGKPVTPSGKITGIRQPMTPTVKSSPVMNPPDYLLQPQLITAQHALLRQQMEMQMQMFKAHRQYDLFKMSNMSHQTQNEFNNKDKH